MLFQSLHEQLNLDSDGGTDKGQVQKRGGTTNDPIVLKIMAPLIKTKSVGEEWLVKVQFY